MSDQGTLAGTDQQEPNWQYVTADDGTVIPLWVHRTVMPSDTVMLLLPALGIPAKFYRTLAQHLANAGITAYCLEQRGNGESQYKPGDGSKFTLKDYVSIDIPAAIAHIKADFENKNKPLSIVLAGHSLGGHMAGLYAAMHPKPITRVIRLACGFPYYGDFKGRSAFFVRLLVWLLPLMTRALGYFPGNRMGFGGREYTGLMMDWRIWAKTGRYTLPDFPDVDQRLKQYDGSVLSIAFDHDTLSSDAASNRGLGYFTSANVKRLQLGEAEQGKYLGHINWARSPEGVVKAIEEWLRR